MADSSNKATTASPETAQMMQANLGLAELQLARERLAIERGKLKVVEHDQKRRFKAEEADREMGRAKMAQQQAQFESAQKQERGLAEMREAGEDRRTKAHLDQKTGFYKDRHKTQRDLAIMELEAKATEGEKNRQAADDRLKREEISALERDRFAAQQKLEMGKIEAGVALDLARLEGDRTQVQKTAVRLANESAEKSLESLSIAEGFRDVAQSAVRTAMDNRYTGASSFARMVDGNFLTGPVSKDGNVYDFLTVAAGVNAIRRDPRTGEFTALIDPEAFRRAEEITGAQGGFFRSTITDDEELAEVETRLRTLDMEFSPDILRSRYATSTGNAVGDAFADRLTRPGMMALSAFRNVGRGLAVNLGLADPDVRAINGEVGAAALLSDVYGNALETATSDLEVERIEGSMHIANMALRNPDHLPELLRTNPEMRQEAQIALTILSGAISEMKGTGEAVEGRKKDRGDSRDRNEVAEGVNNTRDKLVDMASALRKAGVNSADEDKARLEGILETIRSTGTPDEAAALLADDAFVQKADALGVELSGFAELLDFQDRELELRQARATAISEAGARAISELDRRIEERENR